MPFGVVVVGAGQAGFSLVAKLRELQFEGPITLIGEEPYLPYQRPPLTKKYLTGEFERERLFLRPEAFYREKAIDLRLGLRVTNIEAEGKIVKLSSGETMRYDKLVLATGSTPRSLSAAHGGMLQGVYTIRTIDDVDGMISEFDKGRHLLVIGGGYIGLEAAAVAISQGMKVTLIEMADRILQRVAAPDTSTYFRALHKDRGAIVLESMRLDRLIGAGGRVSAALLSSGETLPIDMAVVGIGIDPSTDLAARAGLAIDNGVAVDEYGRTSIPDIFAAGDCASFPYQNKRIRLESVQNAIDQAEATAASLTGKPIPYCPVPWFWSDQYEVKLQIAGLNHGYDTVVSRPGQRPGSLSVWYRRCSVGRRRHE